MTLENQVTPLELSKRLKELGVKQESLFWWDTEDKQFPLIYSADLTKPIYYAAEYISAFTVAELGDMLPVGFISRKSEMNKYQAVWHDKEAIESGYQENTEADARASMLIYLLENSLLTL